MSDAAVILWAGVAAACFVAGMWIGVRIQRQWTPDPPAQGRAKTTNETRSAESMDHSASVSTRPQTGER
jgi:hypothetical protein